MFDLKFITLLIPVNNKRKSSQVFQRIAVTQLTFTCSKSTIEALEKVVKYIQS